MKKLLTSFTALFLITFGFMTVAQAADGVCVVNRTNVNSTSGDSLASAIDSLDSSSGAGCFLQWKEDGDYYYTVEYYAGHFYQGIMFATPETSWGSIRELTMSSAITINAPYDTYIGNFSLDVMTDSSNEVSETDEGEESLDDSILVDAGVISRSKGWTFYGYNENYILTQVEIGNWDSAEDSFDDYGYVVIDATSVSGKPFTCGSTSKNVYLRNMVLITSSYSKSQVLGNDSDSSCLKNGGNLHVCKDANWNGKMPWEDDDWCKSSFTLGDKFVFPGDILDGFPWGKNDCEDEDKVTWYQDADGDGYGNAEATTEDCDQPSGYVDNADDCDDMNADIHPDATEVCDDGIDNNCDGSADCEDGTCAEDTACTEITGETCDDGTDNDGDGYADCDDSECVSDSACTTTDEVCDDGSDNDGDGATDCDDADCSSDDACETDDDAEVCDDGADNDGDGDVDCDDSDCSTASECEEEDVDGDGFSVSAGDCDDSDSDAYPGADEICADFVDNDCDGEVDEAEDCVNTGIGDDIDDGSGVTMEGGAGGCGCDLKAQAAPQPYQMILALLVLLPAMGVTALREKARSNESFK